MIKFPDSKASLIARTLAIFGIRDAEMSILETKKQGNSKPQQGLTTPGSGPGIQASLAGPLQPPWGTETIMTTLLWEETETHQAKGLVWSIFPLTQQGNPGRGRLSPQEVS